MLTNTRRSRTRTRANELEDAERYSNLVLPDGKPLHPKAKDALISIQCPPVQPLGLLHWKCVLKRCDNCPSYIVPKEESGTNENSPTIHFHVYNKLHPAPDMVC